jgi:hypothetical protein
LLTAASPINVERFPLMLALERLERSLGLPSGRGGRRGRARHQQPAMLVWAPGVGGTNARIVRLVRGETKVDGSLGVATGGGQPVSEQEWRRRGRGRARAVGHRGGWGGASRCLLRATVPALNHRSCRARRAEDRPADRLALDSGLALSLSGTSSRPVGRPADAVPPIKRPQTVRRHQ